MKIIVGLGNPGDTYKKNRHNVGFILLDKISNHLSVRFEKSLKLKSSIAKSANIILVKPETYMNNSGDAVSKVVAFFKCDYKDLMIIHDDMDLPLGTIKIQSGAGSAGHNGVEDVIAKLKTKDFNRIRIGIGRPLNNIPPESYVLSDFSDEDLEKILSNKDLNILINSLPQ